MASKDALARDYITNLSHARVSRYEDLPNHTEEGLSSLLDQAGWTFRNPSSQDNRKVVKALFLRKARGYSGRIQTEDVSSALAGEDDTIPWGDTTADEDAAASELPGKDDTGPW